MTLFLNNGYLLQESDNGKEYVNREERSTAYRNLENNQIPYLLTTPLMWLLAFWVLLKKFFCNLFNKKLAKNTLWVDGLSESCNGIKENAASWKALDIVYNFDFQGSNNVISNYWIGMLNGQAVRNRFKIVKEELKQAIFSLKDLPEVRILSIASGSAQVVIEAVEETMDVVNVQVTLLDLDPTALEYSKTLAKQKGVESRIECIRGGTRKINNMEQQPHIVEMVGFLDYRPHKKAIKLLSQIRGLDPYIFITANIIPNREKFPLRHLFDWQMIYRRPDDLKELLEESGFNSSLLVEPVKLYTVAICHIQ